MSDGSPGGAASPCGTGGRGGMNGGTGANGVAGTTNRGGGGGASFCGTTGAAGGSGVVLVRFPSTACISASPGTNSVTSCVGPANDKVATFTVSGTLTVN
jgi:hypothetical protein